MVKTLTGAGGDFNIRAAAAVLIIYKEQFGIEYTEDFARVGVNEAYAVQVGYRLIWSMARAADPNIMDPDKFARWVGADFDLMGAVEQAAEMMHKSLAEFAAEETESGADSGTDDSGADDLSERLVSYAIRCGFSVEDMYHVSVGFLLRSINQRFANTEQTEKSNKDEIKTATDKDIAAFTAFLKG